MTSQDLQNQLDALGKAHEDLSRRLALVTATKAEKAQLADLETQITETIKGLNAAEIEDLKRRQKERDFKPAYPWDTDEAQSLAKVLREAVKPLKDAGVELPWLGVHDSPRGFFLASRFPAEVRAKLRDYTTTARTYADRVGRHRRTEFHRDEAFARLWGE